MLDELSLKYIDFLSQVSKNYDPLLWNASLLGTKNRFLENTKVLLRVLAGDSQIDIKPLPFSERLWLAIKSFKTLTNTYLKSVFAYYYYYKKISQLQGLKDVSILKTFSYKSWKNESYNDRFLGQLGHHLLSRKKNVVTVFESIGIESYKNFYDEELRTVNLLFFFSLSDYLGLTIQLIKNLFWVRENNNNIAEELVAINFQEEIVSPAFIHYLVLYFCFKRMFQTLDVKEVFGTFENNCWEKMLIIAKNDYSSDSKVYLHQHVPISKSAINYFSHEDEYFSNGPDHIFTTGEAPKKLLSHWYSFKGDIVKVGCALRYKYIFDQLPIEPKEETLNKVILAALDGVPMAHIVLEFLNRNREYINSLGIKVVVRFHPIYGIDKINKYTTFDIRERDEWIISNLSLREDLERASFLFYYGSTVSIEALVRGIPIVSIRDEKELLSNDPLWGISTYKYEIDFRDSIAGLLQDMMELKVDLRVAEDLVREEFLEPNEENLENFVIGTDKKRERE